jgi:hypothetical protein
MPLAVIDKNDVLRAQLDTSTYRNLSGWSFEVEIVVATFMVSRHQDPRD